MSTIVPHAVRKLLILGTGTYALDVADLIDDIPELEVVGFVASLPPYTPGATLLDLPVHWVDDLPNFAQTCWAVCALVTTKRHHFIEQAADLGMRFATVVHPSSRVSRRATIGDGTIINSGVQVATHTQLGKHVIVNRGALIGHHNTIHDYATISPGANLAGNVTVGTRAYVGLGANILEKRTIGSQAAVAAGALVTHDVPDRTKVMGAPARVVETDIDGL
jgi:sugar O-acyltransferase (sialic acid O-acetyltransferase NeuD family)